jgi:hypothetical protein
VSGDLAYTLDLKQITNVMLLSSVPYVFSWVVPLYTLASEIRKMKRAESNGGLPADVRDGRRYLSSGREAADWLLALAKQERREKVNPNKVGQ